MKRENVCADYVQLSSHCAGVERLEQQAGAENLQNVVAALPLNGARRILEVGCGTGALSIAIANAVSPTTDVVGVDQSHQHVSFACEQAEMSGLPNVSFNVADVLTMPATHSFDVVLCRYVLMYFVGSQRLTAVLRAMAAQAIPGGTLACIEADIAFGRNWFPQPSADLLNAQDACANYYRSNGLIEWRMGIRLFHALQDAGFCRIATSLVDGRVIQGGEPKTLVDHDCRDLETLLSVVVTAEQSRLLAAEWRRHLRGDGTFSYSPIVVATACTSPFASA